MKQKIKTFDSISIDNLKYKAQNKIFQEIKKLLLEEIFIKFQDIVIDKKLKTLKNALIFDSLRKDLESGRLQYIDGILKGFLSLKNKEEVGLLGGYYNHIQKGYILPIQNMPKYLLNIINRKYEERNKIKSFLQTGLVFAVSKVLNKLDNINYKKEIALSISDIQQSMLKQNIASTFDAIDSDSFVENYARDLRLKIKDFTDSEVLTLRDDIINKIENGTPNKQLKEYLQDRYGVNIRKANRIVENETRLLMYNYQDSIMENQGYKYFFWVHADPNGETSRPKHVKRFKESNQGRLFTKEELPFLPNGKRDDAGEDYGCRCWKRYITEKFQSQEEFNKFLKKNGYYISA